MSDLRPGAFGCRVAEPGLGLVRLIHSSYSDELSRCAAVAAEVFSRWQLGGQALTPSLPSALLVNFGSTEPDPVCQLIWQDRGTNHPRANLDAALKAMRHLVARRSAIGHKPSPADDRVMAEWRRARQAGFGTARSGGYADMWQSSLGLITGPSNDVVLRLDSEADFTRFRSDLRSHPERLTRPVGLDERLRPVAKVAAVSGPLHRKNWDGELLADILIHGSPVLFLPHVATEASPLQNQLDPLLRARNFISPWETRSDQVVPATNLPLWEGREWLKQYEAILRARANLLPAGYQFFLLRTIRELIPICLKIAAQVPDSELTCDEANHLASDLLQMTLRTIVIGVEIVAYHGWGLTGGAPPSDLLKLLKIVRSDSTMSMKALKKKTCRVADQDRDEMLDLLAHHGLLKIGAGEITATPLDQFVTGIPRQSCLPPLALLTTAFHQKMICRRVDRLAAASGGATVDSQRDAKRWHDSDTRTKKSG